MNNELTVVIPNRNSPFLFDTVRDLLEKAEGEVKIIVNIDGDEPKRLVTDDRVRYLRPGKTIGMRAGINACIALATSKYVMKCDDHCMFGLAYDSILKECEDNWVVIPRRYSLDAEHWAIENNPKGPRDYHYLCYPYLGKEHDSGMHGVEWPQRTRERIALDIDDTMSMQGSCWFTTKDHFDNFIGGMSEVGYGKFSQEAQEIGLKTQLGGGRLVVNKNTWYAHLHKGSRYGRMYHLDNSEAIAGSNWSATYWMNNSWEGQIHKLEWLIDMFWPVPTWQDNWRELWDADPRNNHGPLS